MKRKGEKVSCLDFERLLDKKTKMHGLYCGDEIIHTHTQNTMDSTVNFLIIHFGP